MISTDLPASAFAAPVLVYSTPYRNAGGWLCCLCDGTYEHEHPEQRCTVCGVVGLAENMSGPVARHRCKPGAPPDTTLVKSSRPATCAVCREVVTGSIELPTGEHVCGKCVCIALRNMIDDAAACRTETKETK